LSKIQKKKQLGATLITPLSDPTMDMHRVSSAAALSEWGAKVLDLNVTLRREPNLDFFCKSHLFLLQALLENPSLPMEMKHCAMIDMPTVSDPIDKGSEQLQRLIGEQSSQHGAIDLLLDMNRELDDLLDCLDHDVSNYVDSEAKDANVDSQESEKIDLRSTASLGLIRSMSYAPLLIQDFNNRDIASPKMKKLLELVGEAIKKDHFCLQTLCLVLRSMPSKPLSLWLLELQSLNSVFSVRLWRMQDHILLAQIASKFAAFFKSYLQFLVNGLKTAQSHIRSEYSLSPTWYSSFSMAITVADNYKLRIQSLIDIPRLSIPTKTYLSDQGIIFD
jgi:hypothetical protein